MTKTDELGKVIAGYLIASVFWFVMFSPWTKVSINFWYAMIAATGVLTSYSLWFGRKTLKEVYRIDLKTVVIGLAAAAALYLVFFAGNEISRMLFDFTDKQVGNIYGTKSQADRIFIGLFLLLWIGPSEEIFWRGYAQKAMSERFGKWQGFILNALIYAFVHIWAFNFMLFMAALICGLFWGWMYLHYKNVVPGIISHAVWDLVIFIILPIS